MTSEELGCCSKFSKYFLFLFNLTFWIVGIAILAVGIWVLVDDAALRLIQVATVDTSDSLARASAITFVVIGVIVFITAFLGCYGIVKESSCMLLTYASIVGFTLVLQLVAGIMGVVFQSELLDGISSTMNNTVQVRYGADGQEGATEAWDFMQVELKCCGSTIYGPYDWRTSYWFYNIVTVQWVPLTCCVLTNDDYKNPMPVDEVLCQQYAGDTHAPIATNYIHTRGCQFRLVNWIYSYAGVTIGVAFGLVIVQTIPMIIGYHFGKKFRLYDELV